MFWIIARLNAPPQGEVDLDGHVQPRRDHPVRKQGQRLLPKGLARPIRRHPPKRLQRRAGHQGLHGREIRTQKILHGTQARAEKRPHENDVRRRRHHERSHEDDAPELQRRGKDRTATKERAQNVVEFEEERLHAKRRPQYHIPVPVGVQEEAGGADQRLDAEERR